jgi:NAD(P)-dependent dehydrogenase (short-subunit alcohol dehydrogenase family)
MSLNGKVALVTGGASGMGRICALRLARQGAKVAIFDLNEEGLNETVAQSDNITAYTCDISNQEEVNRKVQQVVAELGPIDRLTHAAALMPSRKLVNHTPDEVMRLMQINFAGTVYMIQAVLPSMLERDAGEIIAFGSIAGQAIVPSMGTYCATKAAVNTYVEALIWELSKTNLRIHLVCPPAVNTPLIEQTLEVDTPGSILEAQKSGRLANPEKIVDAIDKGVEKNKKIIYPGEAWFLYMWHALFPSLWWKTLMHFEKE